MKVSQRVRVLGKWIVRALAIGAAATIVVASVQWLVKTEPLQDAVKVSSLEAEWNDTISKLGIEPAYPPEEDLAVGDILAVVIMDGTNELQHADEGGTQNAIS